MSLRRNKSFLKAAVLAGFGLAIASGQTLDNSGNGLLKGTYAFRNVAIQNVDSLGNPTQVTASYGTIVFDGNGNYTLKGTTVDNTVASGAPQTLSTTGTYAIGANGTGYVSSPLFSGSSPDVDDYEYGAVSQGVFAGSATEAADDNGYILNDIFIAIPLVASPNSQPTNSTFTQSYQTGLLDFQGGNSTSLMNALFQLSPDGQGHFGTITLNGQASNQPGASLKQTIAGAAYNFNADGSATLSISQASGGISSANDLFRSGQKTMYQSADGNFILGWSSLGYDVFFGVKALALPATNSITQGLYFTTGLEDSPNISGADSYYGGDSVFGDAAGDAIVHARLNFPTFAGNQITYAYDYGSDDVINLNASGATPVPDYTGYTYLFGDGGNAFVAIGTAGNYALVVGLHAATFSGQGVYLNPVGVANAASYQPITASLAPGELIILTGTGLYFGSDVLSAPSGALPTSLGGVSVTIDGIACPILYVSAAQLAVVVPYELASNTTGLANIQVTSNSVQSNIVQMYLTEAAPGTFSQTLNGIGKAAASHAVTGASITAANPVQPGEIISLYLSGMGTVTPPVADGAVGPSGPFSIADVYTASNLLVYFNDFNNGALREPGTIQFAGLAPGLVGLYQINVQVPAGVFTAGDSVYIEFYIPGVADSDQIQIPYGSTSTANTEIRRARLPGQVRQADPKPLTHRRSRASAVSRNSHN